jgi:uncharacterized protein YecA (UPF0149 family)
MSGPKSNERKQAQLRKMSSGISKRTVKWFKDHANNQFHKSVASITVTKVGRNDPCPCGSGKKYKRCCLK